MLRSAAVASTRAMLRLVIASSPPSILYPQISSAARPLLPLTSLLRFPSGYSRGYGRAPYVLTTEEDAEDDDFDEFDGDDIEDGTDGDELDEDEEDDEDDFGDEEASD